MDGVKKGMRLLVQGRLNMDRFYGDMVLEPVAVMAAEQHVRMDNAPEKRVELHLHTNINRHGRPDSGGLQDRLHHWHRQECDQEG